MATSGLACDSSAKLAAIKMPLMGAFGRCFFSRLKKPNHSERSSSCTEYRPAVSSKMPSVVKNQSQLRVPPMPWITLPALSANGNFSPDLTTAVLLPAAGLPITMYQGNSYSAALPVDWPKREVLIVFTASRMREWMASVSALLLSDRPRFLGSPASSIACSMPRAARRANRLRTIHTTNQMVNTAARTKPAYTSPI